MGMHVSGKIKITPDEYEKISSIVCKFDPNLWKNEIRYYGNYSEYKDEFTMEGQYYDELEQFLDILVENINTYYEISELEMFSNWYRGIYYVYPGKWEFKEYIRPSPSRDFVEYTKTYKFIKETNLNLTEINNDIELNI